jgi:hypothetical protein
MKNANEDGNENENENENLLLCATNDHMSKSIQESQNSRSFVKNL